MRVMMAVHLPPALTVSVAVLIAMGIVVYFIRLGRGGVPAARRRVRRTSVAIMLLALPNFVRGLSFLDPAVDRAEYVVSWSITLVAVAIIIGTALIDVLVSIHVQRGAYDEELREAGATLAEALRKHDEGNATERLADDEGPRVGDASS